MDAPDNGCLFIDENHSTMAYQSAHRTGANYLDCDTLPLLFSKQIQDRRIRDAMVDNADARGCIHEDLRESLSGMVRPNDEPISKLRQIGQCGLCAVVFEQVFQTGHNSGIFTEH